ncbi:phage-shock protein [Alkalihalobacillus alcalophilus ATCC 27647 = CGMCC 1.3604]|uniref:Phage-shock protein n=1 Tax=Alkalihalobacillus alcalophilus ATCC 27647 = CGMCC 1.3604 TaxID=1218173 RepID=A0A094YWZ1_ALKAL|nr:PspA/IM30 family protein [Alkalihalobacillus alcalophilus]KGA98042.1 phage-shock protein [Alkalihalobacillus alcalophilus ATCC 27647 = CGMCC 1.3604]MED1561899.1 PspA/IM30 family protein [Alkalihalobacillus alcalophilus]THG89582.1 phage-shock protein [Alkalihalobacillus alcalophilus ATCC 27647 = CGMCC 1.3604]
MFRFFNRVRTIVSSELNSLLSKAEDPVKMVDQFVIDMENDIADVESAVAKQIANEKLLEKQYAEAAALVTKREEQAMTALETGDEDLARRVLEDKNKHSEHADSLKTSWEEAKKLSEELKAKLREMNEELREMKMKKDSLKARSESAKARTKVNRSLSGIGGAKSGFDRMEEKVMRTEAEAASSEELRSANRSLDDELAALTTSSSVDSELAALKAKMNAKKEESAE